MRTDRSADSTIEIGGQEEVHDDRSHHNRRLAKSRRSLQVAGPDMNQVHPAVASEGRVTSRPCSPDRPASIASARVPPPGVSATACAAGPAPRDRTPIDRRVWHESGWRDIDRVDLGGGRPSHVWRRAVRGRGIPLMERCAINQSSGGILLHLLGILRVASGGDASAFRMVAKKARCFLIGRTGLSRRWLRVAASHQAAALA